ncbi:MAG: hypothetical protein ACI3XS_04620 [Eubacteriales bacterium]
MELLIILLILVIVFLIVKPYFIHYDTVLLFTGGLGSGKSLVSSGFAIKLLKKNRLKVKMYNLLPWHKYKKPKPLLYSSIPFRVSRKEWATQLTKEHMLLQASVVPKSVLFCDEISLFLDQMTVKFPASDNVEEFATLFRHYTQGGYLIMNTQNSNKVNFHFRYCVNEALNLMHFKKWLPFLPLFYTVRVRNISLADDIKTIEEGNKEDNMRIMFGLMPLGFKHYDTYCYSDRYRTVPERHDKIYRRLKSCLLMKCPSSRVKALTTDKDPEDENEIELQQKENEITPDFSLHI